MAQIYVKWMKYVGNALDMWKRLKFVGNDIDM